MALKLPALHRLVLATRLKELLDSSPLLVVYQTLGNVRPTHLTSQLQAALDEAMPNSGITATAVRPKNTITAQATEAGLQPFAHASNILVAWQKQTATQAVAGRQVNIKLDLPALLGAPPPAAQGPSNSSPSSASSSSSPAALPHLDVPHRTMCKLLGLSLDAPKKLPVVLLSGFYLGRSLTASSMEDWMKLDEMTVYAQLLAQIEAPIEGILELESALEGTLSTFDGLAEPHDLLAALDFKAEGGGKQESAAAAPS